MPTVIDSLIVQLRLDPSNFTEGQRRAAENLRQLEVAAGRTGDRIEKSGAGVVTFFRTLESPIAGLRRHFETLATSTARPQRNLADLAAQGRRTGAEIEAGATTGAAGLRVLGIAGLGAFAAITALDKAMSAASDSAKSVFGSSIGAAAAGVPIQQFTAISQALLNKGNVPEAETQGWLARLRTAQIQAQAGHPEAATALNTAFAQAGIGANAFTDSPEQVLLAIASRFQSVSADVAIGLGDMIGQSATLANALHDLGAAGLEAQIQLERQRAITNADSAAARDLIQAQNELDTSWRKMSRLIFDELDPAFTKFAQGLRGAIDAMRELIESQGWGAFFKRTFNPADPNKWWGSGTSKGAPPGAVSGSLADKIAQDESGNRNIPNGRYDATHTASGYFQITDTNWRAYAGEAGVDLAKYPTAMSAPREMQRAVFDVMYRKFGTAPWDKAHGGSQPVATPGAFDPATAPFPTIQNGLHGSPVNWVGNQLGLIQGSQAAGDITHNHGDININGNIHTQATNGEELMTSLRSVAERNRIASQANTGLQ